MMDKLDKLLITLTSEMADFFAGRQGACDNVLRVKKEIRDAFKEASNRWIPVEEMDLERNPEYHGISILVHVFPHPVGDMAAYYDFDLEKWSCSDQIKVTHYQRITEPERTEA